MAKKLKIWNGGALVIKGHKAKRIQHIYICAYSQADASDIINEYNGTTNININHKPEISKYFNAGTWGNRMKGITPERGMWFEIGERPYMSDNKFERVI